MALIRNQRLILPLTLCLGMALTTTYAQIGNAHLGFSADLRWLCPIGECCCNGKTQHIDNLGEVGECFTIFPNGPQGRLWCFVEKNANCKDVRAATDFPGRYWSYQGCYSAFGKEYNYIDAIGR